MKSDFLTKQLVGIFGSLLVTVVLVAGFATATGQTPYHNATVQTAATVAPADIITVTATRLNANQVANATVVCQAAVC